jgi:hypothetical protein
MAEICNGSVTFFVSYHYFLVSLVVFFLWILFFWSNLQLVWLECCIGKRFVWIVESLSSIAASSKVDVRYICILCYNRMLLILSPIVISQNKKITTNVVILMVLNPDVFFLNQQGVDLSEIRKGMRSLGCLGVHLYEEGGFDRLLKYKHIVTSYSIWTR